MTLKEERLLAYPIEWDDVKGTTSTLLTTITTVSTMVLSGWMTTDTLLQTLHGTRRKKSDGLSSPNNA